MCVYWWGGLSTPGEGDIIIVVVCVSERKRCVHL